MTRLLWAIRGGGEGTRREGTKSQREEGKKGGKDKGKSKNSGRGGEKVKKHKTHTHNRIHTQRGTPFDFALFLFVRVLLFLFFFFFFVFSERHECADFEYCFFTRSTPRMGIIPSTHILYSSNSKQRLFNSIQQQLQLSHEPT